MASTYHNIRIHIIFAVKNRRNLIRNLEEFHAYTAGIARGLDCEVVAIGGIADHVHLLLGLKPSRCLADVVREIKKASSTWMRQSVGEFSWQEGYSAFAVGQSAVHSVQAYIENQVEHHKYVDSSQELLKFLQEEGVEVNMKFFE